MDEEAVVAPDLVPGLPGGLEERQRLDVADGAADLGDHDVDPLAVADLAHGEDPVLDLVGDVGDHLDGVAEVVAAALLGDHRRVDLPGRHVGDLTEVGVEEALVVADVEVGLGAVVGDEHLAVLERVHRPGVDVEVGVQLLHGHAQTACLQQAAEARGRESLPEGGGDASGDEHVLDRRRMLHGVLAYPSGSMPSASRRTVGTAGTLLGPAQGQHGGQLTGRAVDAVDGRDRPELVEDRRGRCRGAGPPRPPRTRARRGR